MGSIVSKSLANNGVATPRDTRAAPLAVAQMAASERVRVARSKPTLANPTLANVKVLVVCKDFGFWESIVGFFEINC